MATPAGLSGSAAIALVGQYINEPTLPVPATVLAFLNRGIETVTTRLGGIRLWGQYPTVNQQTSVTLAPDVIDVESASFSMGNAAYNNTGSASPLSQGTLVYPLKRRSQAQFMDAAAGFPAVGFGPPQEYFVYQDYSAAPTATLPAPPAPVLSTTTGTSPGNQIAVVVTYVNANGETVQSATSFFTPTSAEQVVVASPPAVSNATGYNVYGQQSSPAFYLQNYSSPLALGTALTLNGTLTTTLPDGSPSPSPPFTNTATGAGTGGAMSMQLYPAAMIGQINIYYRARPQLWADTTASSWTNLDTSMQEAVVLFAVMRVLANRGRSGEIAPWQKEYETMIEQLKSDLAGRLNPRSGQVRDVANLGYPAGLPWWGGR